MRTQSDILAARFANPVLDAQAVFRAVLGALAEPGTIRPVQGIAGVPAPLSPVAAALVATLCDADTPVLLAPCIEGSDAVRRWMDFHIGAPLVSLAADAWFVVCPDAARLPLLESLAQGTQEYPDRSATVILQGDDFDRGRPLWLRAPGLPDSRKMAPLPAPVYFREQWCRNGANFPRGVDLILAGPDGVAGLPRTTRIVAEG